jgi:hypothetical protein
MAITASRVVNEKNDPTATAFSITTGEEVYAGYPVIVYPTDGLIYNADTHDGYVVGWTCETVASGAKAKVQTGILELPALAGVTSVDVGQSAYVDDNGSVGTANTTDQYCGKIVAVERSGYAFVKIGFPFVV